MKTLKLKRYIFDTPLLKFVIFFVFIHYRYFVIITGNMHFIRAVVFIIATTISKASGRYADYPEELSPDDQLLSVRYMVEDNDCHGAVLYAASFDDLEVFIINDENDRPVPYVALSSAVSNHTEDHISLDFEQSVKIECTYDATKDHVNKGQHTGLSFSSATDLMPLNVRTRALSDKVMELTRNDTYTTDIVDGCHVQLKNIGGSFRYPYMEESIRYMLWKTTDGFPGHELKCPMTAGCVIVRDHLSEGYYVFALGSEAGVSQVSCTSFEIQLGSFNSDEEEDTEIEDQIVLTVPVSFVKEILGSGALNDILGNSALKDILGNTAFNYHFNLTEIL